MPELPEVETLRRRLAPKMIGEKIDHTILERRDLRRLIPADFAEKTKGARIVALLRRAKFLLFTLDNGHHIVIHLGMSGRLPLLEATQPPPSARHNHVQFFFDSGKKLFFYDPRRFGFVDLVADTHLNTYPPLADLGLEPLEIDGLWPSRAQKPFTPPQLQALFAGSTSPLKLALLNQKKLVGLGNIYVCEALYEAKIAPSRQACDIKREEWQALHKAIIDVLNAALAAGGSTLRDFRHEDGKSGYFQHDFKVYDQEGKNCAHNHCSGVVTRITQGGRSTFFCPDCQR